MDFSGLGISIREGSLLLTETPLYSPRTLYP